MHARDNNAFAELAFAQRLRISTVGVALFCLQCTSLWDPWFVNRCPSALTCEPDMAMKAPVQAPSDFALSDLAQRTFDIALLPAPTLKWIAEPNAGGKNTLYHVWADSASSVWAVGTSGIILARQSAGSWTTETAGTAGDLYGAFGLSGNGVWAVGDTPGAWRRDRMSGNWLADQSGLVLGPQGVLWSITTGAVAGELWAGGDDGKVWHRTGSPAASGSWQSEQALPSGVAVFGIAYADGTVFAVGQRGYVAVRKDSGGGARWQAPYQYPELVGKTLGRDDGLYGVSAYDRDTAVAVGSKSLLCRYMAGQWMLPQTIDPSGDEFNAVWGTSVGRVWAVGYGGLIVRVEGSIVTELRSDPNLSLYGIHGRSDTDVYAVGSSLGGFSLILHGQP